MTDRGARLPRGLALLPRWAAGFAAAVGTVVLLGWALDVKALQTMLPGAIPMRANTAVAFVFAGAALAFVRRPAGRVAAVVVLAIAAAVVTEYLAGFDLHIDELLFRAPLSGLRAPGRMAFTAAASLLSLGAALLLASTSAARMRRTAEVLGALVGLFALFEIEGYMIGTVGPAGYTKMALHTAFVLVVLSVGVITAVPDGWLVARVIDRRSAGILARRLLPTAIGLPLALGAVGHAGEAAGWLDAPSSIAFMVIATIVLLLAATVWSVATVERVERELRETEDRFQWFFEEAPIGKLLVAPDGKLLRVNRALCALLGYSREEAQSVSWMDITHPDDLTQSREAVRVLLTGEAAAWHMEKRYRTRDGRWVWTHVTIGLHRGPDGTPLNFLTHVQDISDRKVAEERRAALVQELQTALSEVKTLRGILPICAQCKRIHAAGDVWEPVESYVHAHTDAQFSHGLCPDCASKTWGAAGVADG